MIQGGDPTATGRGGASIYGKNFADEISQELKHTGAGILSMANSGPNTNGSQFFITLAPTNWLANLTRKYFRLRPNIFRLDGKHTVFGRIQAGMRTVKMIGQVETDSDDRPVDDVKIVRASANS